MNNLLKRTLAFGAVAALILIAPLSAEAHHRHGYVVVRPAPVVVVKPARTVVVRPAPAVAVVPCCVAPGRVITHAIADAIWWNAVH